ncbi:uncharacterized protein ACLA_069420 [Aspergillus clavatus NRRL 1]|uniref:Uncharacterized protein n=1 Tax=Aspergillus clavatus (strain ATCC 1007 / CBS 513.65 / DSM 816 / NCTC 3887 / NRRL 1 / QM 1276 / 107) TaxID=344612 RepID=A1C691_ASPCL|nr:uncharacterized protein ACLA_069420 [Aspergillus clavatus NRRL 1]EAW13912.1 hypothetical protein ACLA_069420 [Aspergillus clavatus NRRL 1]
MSMFDYFVEYGTRKQRQGSPQVEQASSIRLQAARAIGGCLRHHREVYGLVQIPRYLLEAVNNSCLVLITDLSNEESQGYFRETCLYLVAMKRRLSSVKEMIEKIECLVGVGTFSIAVGLTQLDVCEPSSPG